MMLALTIEQAKALRPGTILHHRTLTNRDGSPARFRVNGQVKTWKRSPSRVKVPLKHGMYTYDYLTEANLDQFCLPEGGTTMTRPLYRDYSAIEADLPALLELALSALYHGETCELVFLDRVTGLSTNELSLLRDRLESFMQADPPAGSTGSPLARALAALEITHLPEPDDNLVEAAMNIYFGNGPTRLGEATEKEKAAARSYATAYALRTKTGAASKRVTNALAAADAVYQEG